ncbi:MAG: OmcA/MtrC family decaheme c-type cytochrome [Acidobacteria bacterium]|nr:OmcA/MtrC family decaheme c-type cytochrome [Acidobacteriota bacterium]
MWPSTTRHSRTLIPALALFLTAMPLFSADSGSTRKAKSDFLSEKEQSFIRPGLQVQITRAWLDADGTAHYSFTVGDSAGAPLDLDGVVTPGAITMRAVLASIPAGQTLYTAYTVRNSTSSITGATATQATSDSGGTFEKTGDGAYTYTFRTKVPSSADRSVTHTVAVWANRNLEEFELGEASAADTYDWVPDGSAEPHVTLSVTDAKCNQCHGKLSAHDNRTTVAVCVTCHQPQSSDPDTGNNVDLATMVHKIHMGEGLPSVEAGEPYQIIGFGNAVHDFSTVVYPADVRNCQTCHVEEPGSIPAPLTAEIAPSRSRGRSRSDATLAALAGAATTPQQAGAPDANRHLLNPSRRACGACHDNVNFATGENHASLPQISDNQCNRCHNPQGELEFDLSIKGAHTIDRFSKDLPGVNFEIMNVTNGTAGQKPTVSFSIKDDAGAPIPPSSMTRLSLVLGAAQGGDFAEAISETATIAQGDSGVYFYTFQNATIPEDAGGNWAVGIEGYKNATLLAGTEKQMTVRDAGDNDVYYFNVSGGAASPRRTVVFQQKCDSCHFDLSLHGGNRNEVQHCVLCHNPMGTDISRRPADAGAPESINFKDMIHRIHSGEHQAREFSIFGFGGAAINFNHVRYPRPLSDCAACHADGTQELPLAADLLPTVDPRGFFNPALPATAACLDCHVSLSAAAHADLNTSASFGESCDVCHGAGSEFDVQKVHAQ